MSILTSHLKIGPSIDTGFLPLTSLLTFARWFIADCFNSVSKVGIYCDGMEAAAVIQHPFRFDKTLDHWNGIVDGKLLQKDAY